jgi:phage shock protein E
MTNEAMNWFTWLIVGAAVGGFVVMKRLTLVGPTAAREWLRQGAKVIDVRSEVEFRERRLPGAINIPLDQLRREISRHVSNKERGVLLHCLSGGRSSLGKAMLKRMGYRNVFNLGSYGRAEGILSKQTEV